MGGAPDSEVPFFSPIKMDALNLLVFSKAIICVRHTVNDSMSCDMCRQYHHLHQKAAETVIVFSMISLAKLTILTTRISICDYYYYCHLKAPLVATVLHNISLLLATHESEAGAL